MPRSHLVSEVVSADILLFKLLQIMQMVNEILV